MNDLEQLKQELLETKNKCTEIEKKIEELEKQTSGARWKAQKNKRYYYFASCGDIKEDYDNCYVDTIRYYLGNYFRTKEEAKKIIEKIKIYTQLKDLALKLNKGREICWNDFKQAKYCISRDVEYDELIGIPTRAYQEMGQIYCLDENFLEEAKQEIGEENLRKLFM